MLRITNIDEISKIKIIPNPINTRIKRECQKMKDNYDEIIIEYTDNGIILITFKKMCNTYKFNIPRHYPFISPRLSVNDMDQNLFFNLKTTRFKTILKYVSGLDCLCCNSYVCKNNWSPSVTMEVMINQIKQYKTYKYFIFIKLILDKIKEKYLHRDINLDSWLFNIYE